MSKMTVTTTTGSGQTTVREIEMTKPPLIEESVTTHKDGTTVIRRRGDVLTTPQTKKVYQQYQEGEIGSSEVETYIDSQLKNYGLTPQVLITEAPEGYYYAGGDVQEYNRAVVEYNRKVREYRKQVLETLLSKQPLEPSEGLTTYTVTFKDESGENQTRIFASEDEANNFIAGYKATKEGPPFTGAGVKGIPGPGMGPVPGSLGARIQETVSPWVESGLKAIEQPFRAVTDPLRTKAADMNTESVTKAADNQVLLGFGLYGGSVALDVAAMGIDVATFAFRPGLWVDVSRSIAEITVNPEARSAALQQILKDPFRFSAEMVGGAYLGSKIIDAAYKVPGQVRRVKARYDWTRYGDEELFRAAEMEMGMQFPEEIMSYETSRTLYKRSSVKLSSLKGGVSVELPYYSETMPELEKVTQQILDKAEEWAPRQITKRTDTALGYGPLEGEYGFLKAEGRMGGMKPFKEPTVEIPARSEQITVLTEKGVASSPIKSMFKQADMILENIQTEPITSYLKPIQFRDVLTLPTIRAPEFSFKSFEALIPIAGFKAVEFSDTRIINQLKSFDAQITKTLQRSLSLEVEIPKLGTPQIPKIGEFPVQTPVQEPKATQIQIPTFKVPQIQIQEPKLDIPVVPGIPRFPTIPTQPRSRVVIKKEIEGKGKRKGKKRKKEAWELRADKVFSFKFKEPKVKGMEL